MVVLHFFCLYSVTKRNRIRHLFMTSIPIWHHPGSPNPYPGPLCNPSPNPLLLLAFAHCLVPSGSAVDVVVNDAGGTG